MRVMYLVTNPLCQNDLALLLSLEIRNAIWSLDPKYTQRAYAVTRARHIPLGQFPNCWGHVSLSPVHRYLALELDGRT